MLFQSNRCCRRGIFATASTLPIRRTFVALFALLLLLHWSSSCLLVTALDLTSLSDDELARIVESNEKADNGVDVYFDSLTQQELRERCVWSCVCIVLCHSHGQHPVQHLVSCIVSLAFAFAEHTLLRCVHSAHVVSQLVIVLYLLARP